MHNLIYTIYISAIPGMLLFTFGYVCWYLGIIEMIFGFVRSQLIKD